jgi:hypothetical protein
LGRHRVVRMMATAIWFRDGRKGTAKCASGRIKDSQSHDF